MKQYLLAIDQGTTNSRAIIFNSESRMLACMEKPLSQSFPQLGWVEQDPMQMVENIKQCCIDVIAKAQIKATDIAAIGITNQRETTIVWNKKTGKPIYPAIVWQDRRTHEHCRTLQQHPLCAEIVDATGLVIDPYFSATKLHWLLDNVQGARQQAEAGELLFGTVDTFLIWHLTQDHHHVTDATNASRTLLFNIKTQQWDQRILNLLAIPAQMLPTVLDNTAHFGDLDPRILGEAIPILGVAGDQQAATIGQACFKPGMMKTTYGTGGFLLVNTGEEMLTSQNQLLATIAYRINGKVTYGLEGSIFSAGEIVKWLRDQLHLIAKAAETETLAASVSDNQGVYLVPAFTGLGAPYWRPEVRACISGIGRNTGREHIVRAGLESIAYQTRDLLLAMQKDGVSMITALRVDGGMVANNWFLQFLCDMLQVTVERPQCIETTALGAAYLAGLQAGLFKSLEDISHHWQIEQTFKPKMSVKERDGLYTGWLHAVEKLLS